MTTDENTGPDRKEAVALILQADSDWNEATGDFDEMPREYAEWLADRVVAPLLIRQVDALAAEVRCSSTTGDKPVRYLDDGRPRGPVPATPTEHDPDCGVCRAVGGPHGVPASADTTGEA